MLDKKTEWAHLCRMAAIPGWVDQAKHRAAQLEPHLPGVVAALNARIAQSKTGDQLKGRQ